MFIQIIRLNIYIIVSVAISFSMLLSAVYPAKAYYPEYYENSYTPAYEYPQEDLSDQNFYTNYDLSYDYNTAPSDQSRSPQNITEFIRDARDIGGVRGMSVDNRSLYETLIHIGNNEGRGYDPAYGQTLVNLFTYAPEAKDLSGEQFYQALGAANYERSVGFINDTDNDFNYSFSYHTNRLLDR